MKRSATFKLSDIAGISEDDVDNTQSFACALINESEDNKDFFRGAVEQVAAAKSKHEAFLIGSACQHQFDKVKMVALLSDLPKMLSERW